MHWKHPTRITPASFHGGTRQEDKGAGMQSKHVKGQAELAARQAFAADRWLPASRQAQQTGRKYIFILWYRARTTQSWLKRWLDVHYPDLHKWLTPLHVQVPTCVMRGLGMSVLLPVRFSLIRHVPRYNTSCRRRWHCLHCLCMYFPDILRHGLTIPALTGVQPSVLHPCRQIPYKKCVVERCTVPPTSRSMASG